MHRRTDKYTDLETERRIGAGRKTAIDRKTDTDNSHKASQK